MFYRNLFQSFKSQNRHFSNRILFSSDKIIPGIIGINALVFLGWKYSEYRLDYKGDARLKRWIIDHFYASSYTVLNKFHFWTLATSSFFHTQLLSFGINMFVLYSFGPSLIYILGPQRFLRLYVGSSVFSSMSCLAYEKLYPQKRSGGYMGAGGPISALTIYYALLNPNATFMIYFLFPVPAIYAAAGFVGYNVYTSLSSYGGGAGAVGQIGGAFAGWMFWYLKRLRIKGF